MKRHFDRCAPLLIGAVVFLTGCGYHGNREIRAEIQRQRQWLAGRQVPNAAIPHPLVSRRHLVASYEVPKGDPSYRFIYNKSFLYDNALAAIAFCHTGDWERARNILQTLSRMIRKNGSYWFNFNLEVEWPSETDREMTIIRTGTIAWLGYAYCFYLENRPSQLKDPANDAMFLETAEKIASFILVTMDKDTASPSYGLVRGGKGEIEYAVSPDAHTVVEEYSDTPLYWVSTEHNIDAHLFFSHLNGLTRETKYRTYADILKRRLIALLWSGEKGQFIRGIRDKGVTVDTVRALDCASWAAIFLKNAGRDSLAQRCLNSIQRMYANTIGNTTGYLPYKGCRIYESQPLNTFFYPQKTDMAWGDFPFFWWEGNFGVVLAQWYCGRRDSVQSSMLQWTRLFQTDTPGGIPYSTAIVPYQFQTWKSVAGTAWYIIVASIASGKKMKRPFFS